MSELVFPSSLEPLQQPIGSVLPHLQELIHHYRPVRQDLLRKKSDLQRADFSRLLELPEETRAIREAEWQVKGGGVPHRESWIDFESDPELSSRHSLGLYQKVQKAEDSWVRTRSLFHEEKEILQAGRAIPGLLLNLALTPDRHILFVPKLETRFEARALNELLHFWNSRSGTGIRVGVEFETVRGVVEAEEIFFELKDFIVAASFDPVDYLCNLIRKLSGQRDFLINPFREEQRFGLLAPLSAHLQAMAERRGVAWIRHPSAQELGSEGSQAFFFPKIPHFRTPGEEEVRALIRESLHYLVDAVASVDRAERTPDSERYSRFELSRSLLWQWLHHEAIQEDLYQRLRDLEKAQHADPRIESATQLLDTLLLNGSFVDFAGLRSA